MVGLAVDMLKHWASGVAFMAGSTESLAMADLLGSLIGRWEKLAITS